MSIGSVTMIIGAHSAVLISDMFLSILLQSQEAFGGEALFDWNTFLSLLYVVRRLEKVTNLLCF